MGNINHFYEPTAEEIKQQCAEIRSKWTEREREWRLAPAYRNKSPEMRTYDYLEANQHNVSRKPRGRWKD